MNRYLHISVTSPKRGCFVIVFENITERKQAADALKDSRQQLGLSKQQVNLTSF